jgi:hypothetical protein
MVPLTGGIFFSIKGLKKSMPTLRAVKGASKKIFFLAVNGAVLKGNLVK